MTPEMYDPVSRLRVEIGPRQVLDRIAYIGQHQEVARPRSLSNMRTHHIDSRAHAVLEGMIGLMTSVNPEATTLDQGFAALDSVFVRAANETGLSNEFKDSWNEGYRLVNNLVVPAMRTNFRAAGGQIPPPVMRMIERISKSGAKALGAAEIHDIEEVRDVGNIGWHELNLWSLGAVDIGIKEVVREEMAPHDALVIHFVRIDPDTGGRDLACWKYGEGPINNFQVKTDHRISFHHGWEAPCISARKNLPPDEQRLS